MEINAGAVRSVQTEIVAWRTRHSAREASWSRNKLQEESSIQWDHQPEEKLIADGRMTPQGIAGAAQWTALRNEALRGPGPSKLYRRRNAEMIQGCAEWIMMVNPPHKL